MSVIDKFKRKISGKRAGRARKDSLYSCQMKIWMISLKSSLEKSSLLTDWATETVKHEIKKQEGGFLCAMPLLAASLIALIAFSLIQPLASSLINDISRDGVVKSRKGQEGGILLLLAKPLIMKLWEKDSEGKEEDIIIRISNNKQYWDYYAF